MKATCYCGSAVSTSNVVVGAAGELVWSIVGLINASCEEAFTIIIRNLLSNRQREWKIQHKMPVFVNCSCGFNCVQEYW